jgi:SAM-dependent methyltransferase
MRLDNEEALDFLRSLEHAAQKEISDYLSNALDRLGATFELVPSDLPPKAEVLEIGALPYYMTALLLRYTDFAVSAINEPSPRGDIAGYETIRSDKYNFSETVAYQRINIEYDPFPYPGNHFDMVLYCEVIEHMTYDPTQTLYEIHRVLKPHGRLIVTTPNPFRYTNILRFLRGKSIYPHYSGYNRYARHHREFSVSELRQLLISCNFEVDEVYTIHDQSYDHPRYLDAVVRGALRLGAMRGQQDVVMLRARAKGKPRYGYPADLYVDVHAYDRVTESKVVMGENEEPQLGGGWYPREDWPPNIRWTGREASIRLLCEGQETVSVYLYSGPKELGRTVTGTISLNNIEHHIEMPPDEWLELSFPVPPEADGRLLVIFKWDEPWHPHEVHNSPDTREIGVAINKIWLHYDDAQPSDEGEG